MSLSGPPKREEFDFVLWEEADRGDMPFQGVWTLGIHARGLQGCRVSELVGVGTG